MKKLTLHVQIFNQSSVDPQSFSYLLDNRIEVLIMVNIKITVIWDITKCTLVDMRQYMEFICCFHLEGLPR